MSILSGFSSSMTSDDDSRKRSKGAKNTMFELRERIDVTVDISRSKHMVTMHRESESLHKAVLDTIGVAKSLGGYLPVRYYLDESQEGFGRMKTEVIVKGLRVIPYVHMKREIRAHLAGEHYYDVDMVNCQPSLLRQKLELSGISCPLLDKYVSGRDACLSEVAASCKVSRDAAKNLFIRLVYFGSVKCWAEELAIAMDDVPTWVMDLKTELQHNAVLLLALPEFEDFKRYYSKRSLMQEDDDLSSHKIKRSSQLALYLQTLECECVRALVAAVTADQRSVGGIIYDGLLIEKETGETGLPPHLLKRWSNAVMRKTGYLINLSVKEFKTDPAWLSPSPLKSEWDDSWMNGLTMMSYEEMKVMWEKRSFKIVQGGNYIREEKDLRVTMTDRVLNDSYKHIHYAEMNRTTGPDRTTTIRLCPFITRWIKDPLLRCYKTMVFKPPPLTTPENAYNIWNGFAVGRSTPVKAVKVEKFIEFFHILCGRNERTSDYMLDWIAQIFQEPSKKSGVAVILKGEEGVGKNRASDLISAMVGKDKSLSTASPKSTLYGEFTALREGRFLIVINEANGGDNFAANDIIKDMITSETFVCNGKNQNSYPIECYARFMFTTNNENCLKIESGSRRYFVIDVSSELKGDTEYFKSLSTMIDDEGARHAFYLYLMTRDISKRDWINDRPLSDSFVDMVDLNLPFEHSFIKDLMMTTPLDIVSMQLETLYREFVDWMSKSRELRHDTSNKKFGLKMTKLISTIANKAGFRGVTKKRTMNGILYTFDVSSIRHEMLEKNWIRPEDLNMSI